MTAVPATFLGLPSYRVTLTRAWVSQGSVDAHRSFEATVEWLGMGSWQLVLPRTHQVGVKCLDLVVAAYKAGGRRAAAGELRQWGVRVRPPAGGVDAFAGQVRSLTVTDGATDAGPADSLILRGVSDMGVLADATGYPGPGVDSSTVTPAGWAVYADGPWPSGEAAIRDVVADNMGATALARRRLPGLQVPAVGSPALGGGTFDLQRRFPNLLEWVRTVCLLRDLTASLVRVPGGLRLDVTEQATNDRVRLSRTAGTLSGAAVTFTADGPDSVLVGGAGEGTARVLLRTDATPAQPSTLHPFELFVDDTSNADTAGLRGTGQEKLEDLADEPTATVAAPKALPFVPAVDYQAGDLLPVTVGRGDGRIVTARARVQSYALSHTQGRGWRAEPRIGQPFGDPVQQTARVLADLTRARKR